MSKDYQAVAQKSVKVAGAFAMVTGIVALSAVVASGAAVGAVVEGFKAAGTAVKDVLAKNEKESKEATTAEVTNIAESEESVVEV